jgi:hypothetical protein
MQSRIDKPSNAWREKMAKEYNHHEHDFVTVSLPVSRIPGYNELTGDDLVEMKRVVKTWECPLEIALHVGPQVWVYGFFAMKVDLPEIKQVGDGCSNGFDRDGNCIYSVPASWCEFYTESEAEQKIAALDAAEQLRSYM